jgi:hypothetical protein
MPLEVRDHLRLLHVDVEAELRDGRHRLDLISGHAPPVDISELEPRAVDLGRRHRRLVQGLRDSDEIVAARLFAGEPVHVRHKLVSFDRHETILGTHHRDLALVLSAPLSRRIHADKGAIRPHREFVA